MSSGVITLRAEIGSVCRLAVPFAVSQLGMMLMGFVDTMMVGRVSETDLAAVGLGVAIMMSCVVPIQGVLMGLDPFLSQAAGAGDLERVRRWRQRGWVLAMLLSVPLMGVLLFPEPLLHLLNQDPEIISKTAAYVRANVLGICPLLLFSVTRQSLLAMSHVRPVVWAVFLANGINVLANWVFVFGNLGFEPLGGVGAGWATSASRISLFVFLEAAARIGVREVYGQWSRSILELRRFLDVLRIGIPMGLHIGLEYWGFSAATIMMGHLGTTALAGHQIAINLSSLTFMIPLGISAAATTRVGNAIGRRDQLAARRGATASLCIGASFMMLAAAMFALFPEPLARLYAPDEPRVIALAATLLPIAAIFQVFDGLQVVSAGVLRGTADARVPATIALIGFWGLGLPAGWWLAFRSTAGPRGPWWGLTIGLSTVAILLLLRIQRRFRREIAPVEESEGAARPSKGR